MLYMQGVRDIGSVRASLIGTVEPVSATITSAVILGTVFLPTDLYRLCRDHRDDVPHGVAGAAAKTEKVLCRIFAN